jgi:hypothetical protein
MLAILFLNDGEHMAKNRLPLFRAMLWYQAAKKIDKAHHFAAAGFDSCDQTYC